MTGGVLQMSKIMKAGVLGLLVLAMGLSPALAAKPGKGKKDASTVEKRFKKMDRNSDGKVSLDEMKNRGKKNKKNKNA
jgi:hypothetical protein